MTHPELAELVALAAIRPLHSGHAYSPKEITELRSILKASAPPWDDERLFRLTDECFAYVGLSIKSERALRPLDRIREIHKRFRLPATQLLTALHDEELTKEFLGDWSGYKNFDADGFTLALTSFLQHTDNHLKAIKRHAKRGKSWDSDLKRHFVYAVAMICEYIEKDFEPSRYDSHSPFTEVANLLGSALFRKPDGRPASFDGAIRELVTGGTRIRRPFYAPCQMAKNQR